MNRVLAVVVVVQFLHSAVIAAPVDFVRDVRPIFEKHCYSCHGAEKHKSSLRLDIKSQAFQGGESYGPSIVPGKSDDSPLIQFVRGDDKDMTMPPEGQRLSAAEVATLTRWVDEGSVWPDGVDLARLVDKRDHWSFKPVTNPIPPKTKDKAWPRNEIDHFILARLEHEGLQPVPEADRITWLRRASFDLIGLPPTPERAEAFVNDPRNDAYERAVDELLNSPRYGERWAQHWLDVVRYADTYGFEVNQERPNAWPYRDYAIDAFNQDTPFDRFVREQIAGDFFRQDAATGFLVTASILQPGQIGKDEPSQRLARQDSLDEIVVNIGQTFLGLSVGCARCHDHKFDPISARDYYSMQAFVAGVEYRDRDLRTPAADSRRKESKQLRQELIQIERQLARLAPLAKSGAQRAPVSAHTNTDRFAPVKAKRLRFTINATNSLEPSVDELEVFDTDGQNVALAAAGTTATSSNDTDLSNGHALRYLNDGHYGNTRSWLSDQKGKGWVELAFAAEHVIERVDWGRDRENKYNDRLATDYRIEVADASNKWRIVADSTDRQKYDPAYDQSAAFSTTGLSPDDVKQVQHLLTQKTHLESRITAVQIGQQVFAGRFRRPDVIHLLNRGDPEQPKEEVTPAIPTALGNLKLREDLSEQERRLALANWVASPQNPLTARVMVNRVWQGHFGTGIVETASDFGRTGTKPSHPELLDWLAQRFVRSGWSIKSMHRLIVLSATYRQSTRYDATTAGKDSDVRLLWRFPSRRLDAEAIRDSMLAVSGRLNLKMGGPGFNLFDKRGGLTGFTPVESFRGDGLRRMIYAHKVRRERDAVFGAFDCPDGGQSTARRRESTTPIQALNLFNSRFTIEQSAAFAARVETEVGQNTTKEIVRVYQLALSRNPSSAEVADVAPIVTEYGLPTLCRALFNCNEFLLLP